MNHDQELREMAYEMLQDLSQEELIIMLLERMTAEEVIELVGDEG